MRGKKIFGLFLIAFGVFLILNITGTIDYNYGELFKTYWPVFIILIGLVNVINKSGSRSFGVFLIILGSLFQLRALGIFNALEFFWPIVIILIGIWIVFSRGTKWNTSSEDELNAFAVFGGYNVRNQSRNFNGGNVSAVFGGIDVDLRQAHIESNKTVKLDVFAAFGGVEMVVPDGWKVQVTGLPLFAGWDNKTSKNLSDNAPTLKVNCFAMFGGFEVKN